MPRRVWRDHSYCHSYSCNYDNKSTIDSDFMKQIQSGTQFVKIFDHENGKDANGKWCIGQIISLWYNKEKSCKQFQVCVYHYIFTIANATNYITHL